MTPAMYRAGFGGGYDFRIVWMAQSPLEYMTLKVYSQ